MRVARSNNITGTTQYRRYGDDDRIHSGLSACIPCWDDANLATVQERILAPRERSLNSYPMAITGAIIGHLAQPGLTCE